MRTLLVCSALFVMACGTVAELPTDADDADAALDAPFDLDGSQDLAPDNGDQSDASEPEEPADPPDATDDGPEPWQGWFAGTGSLCSFPASVCEGALCNLLPTPIGGRVGQLHADEAGALWLDGWFGTLRFDADAGWAVVDPTPVTVGLSGSGAVFGIAPGEDARTGRLMRSDGGPFVAVEGPPENLAVVFGTGPQDLWVAEPRHHANPTPVYPTLHHFDGDEWTSTAFDGAGLVTWAFAVSPDRAWVATSAGLANRAEPLYVWNGATWEPEAPELARVVGTSETNLWAWGHDGGLYHDGGEGWLQVSDDDVVGPLAVTADGAVWAIVRDAAGQTHRLARWLDGGWTNVPSLEWEGSLVGVPQSMVAVGDDVWIAGDEWLVRVGTDEVCGAELQLGHSAAVREWEDVRLTAASGDSRYAAWWTRTGTVLALQKEGGWDYTRLAPNVWVAQLIPWDGGAVALVNRLDGSGTILGSAVLVAAGATWELWRELSAGLYAADAWGLTSGALGIAAAYQSGRNAWSSRFFALDGDSLTTLHELADTRILAVEATAEGHLWAVGVAGSDSVLWRYDGVSWQSLEGPAMRSPPIMLAAIADDDVWVAGGSVAHWDGESWAIHCPEALTNPRDFWVRDDGEVLLALQWGLHHFDGDTWRRSLAVDVAHIESLGGDQVLLATDYGLLEGPIPAPTETVCQP